MEGSRRQILHILSTPVTASTIKREDGDPCLQIGCEGVSTLGLEFIVAATEFTYLESQRAIRGGLEG